MSINTSPLAPFLYGENIPNLFFWPSWNTRNIIVWPLDTAPETRTHLSSSWNPVLLASLPSALPSLCLVILTGPLCLVVFEILCLASSAFHVWLFYILNLVTGTSEAHGVLHLCFVISLASVLCWCCLVTMCLEQTLIASSSLVDHNLEKTPWALSHGCFPQTACVCLGKKSWCVLGHLRAFQMSRGNPGPPDHRF